MIRKILSFASVIIFASVFFAGTAYSATYSKDEVMKQIDSVQKALNNYVEKGTEGVGREINKIENYIKQARVYLNDNDRDEAWYEIKKAEPYFWLIDAKKKLFESEKKYQAAKNR